MTNQPEAAIRLAIPASSAYLSLARAATSAVCARMDFSIEQIEDTTLAVNEAASLLLVDAQPDSELQISWQSSASDLRVELVSHSSSGRPPRRTTFAWTVLSALVDDVDAVLAADRIRLSLTIHPTGALAR